MGITIQVIDDDDERRSSIVLGLSKSGIGGIILDQHNVPGIDTGESIEAFQAKLHSADGLLALLVHVRNRGARPFVKTCLHQFTEIYVVLYSGGNESNFNIYQKLINQYNLPTVPNVGADYVSKLVLLLKNLLQTADIKPLAPKTKDPSNSARIAPANSVRTALVDNILPSGQPVENSNFEKRRADLSHDTFTNSFCSALGFNCTDPGRNDRGNLMIQARDNRKLWDILRRRAETWPDIKSRIDSLVLDAQKIVEFSRPTKELTILVDEAGQAMDSISAIMGKFAGPLFEKSYLTDNEIREFWLSADVVRALLKAFRLTDDGLDRTYFIVH